MNKLFRMLSDWLPPKMLKMLNVVVGVLCVILGLVAFADLLLIFPKYEIMEGLKVSKNSEELKKLLDPLSDTPKKFEEFEPHFSNTDLFVASSRSLSDSRFAGGAAGGSALKNFSLVGILSGDQLQAILEDSSTKKVQTLSVGQSFNQATVKDIQDGSVVLEYNGESVTLTI